MIDIHSHILYGVDDGASSADLSSAMLDDAARQGITDMIATPHYRSGMFPYHLGTVLRRYEETARIAASKGIRLYLGCEYHADTDMVNKLRSRRVATLAGSDYVLTEFSYSSTYINVRNTLEELISCGFIPVMAHVERYGIVQDDPDILVQFKEMGSLIQINTNSVLGLDGHGIKRAARKILKKDLADIVASDCHDMKDRRSHMLECREYIEKKFGRSTARRLFERNPGMILPEE